MATTAVAVRTCDGIEAAQGSPAAAFYVQELGGATKHVKFVVSVADTGKDAQWGVTDEGAGVTKARAPCLDPVDQLEVSTSKLSHGNPTNKLLSPLPPTKGSHDNGFAWPNGQAPLPNRTFLPWHHHRLHWKPQELTSPWHVHCPTNARKQSPHPDAVSSARVTSARCHVHCPSQVSQLVERYPACGLLGSTL